MSDDRCDLLCLDLERAEQARAGLVPEGMARTAASRAGALSDATRLRVAGALSAVGELCVCDVAWVIGRSDKLASHHLGVLRTSGLAESRRAGKVVFYRLTPTGRDLLDLVLQPDRAGADR